jgi:hypothetical protein
LRHYCLIFDFSYGHEAGAIDDLIVSNYLISKIFLASLNAWSDLGTDLDIKDYIGIKRCDETTERTIDLVKCQKEGNCHDGTR